MRRLDEYPHSPEQEDRPSYQEIKGINGEFLGRIKGMSTWIRRCVVPHGLIEGDELKERVSIGDNIYFITSMTPGKKADELLLTRERIMSVEEKLSEEL
jgi:hypothetical protein